jgi:hypothetical protein
MAFKFLFAYLRTIFFCFLVFLFSAFLLLFLLTRPCSLLEPSSYSHEGCVGFAGIFFRFERKRVLLTFPCFERKRKCAANPKVLRFRLKFFFSSLTETVFAHISSVSNENENERRTLFNRFSFKYKTKCWQAIKNINLKSNSPYCIPPIAIRAFKGIG